MRTWCTSPLKEPKRKTRKFQVDRPQHKQQKICDRFKEWEPTQTQKLHEYNPTIVILWFYCVYNFRGQNEIKIPKHQLEVELGCHIKCNIVEGDIFDVPFYTHKNNWKSKNKFILKIHLFIFLYIFSNFSSSALKISKHHISTLILYFNFSQYFDNVHSQITNNLLNKHLMDCIKLSQVNTFKIIKIKQYIIWKYLCHRQKT